MNTHKHARLTFARRIEMVRQMTEQGLNATQAAAAQGVTAPTARKWLGRFLAGGVNEERGRLRIHGQPRAGACRPLAAARTATRRAGAAL